MGRLSVQFHLCFPVILTSLPLYVSFSKGSSMGTCLPWLLQHRLYCFYSVKEFQFLPPGSLWVEPICVTLLWWGKDRRDAGHVWLPRTSLHRVLSYQHTLVSDNTEAHRHKTLMDWLMWLLYSAGVSGHEAHLRYDVKLIPGCGMICGLELETLWEPKHLAKHITFKTFTL